MLVVSSAWSAALVVVLCCLLQTSAVSRGIDLIKADSPSASSARLGRRRLGCSFGERFFEVGAEWHPDLGAPVGPMPCVRCKCLAGRRKRRVRAKTACRNYVKLCPRPNCDQPTLEFDRCCKLCPNQTIDLDIFGDKQKNGVYSGNKRAEAGVDKLSEFLALMVGQYKDVRTAAVGRAYLTLAGRHLHFSVVLDGLAEATTSIQFVDESQTILHEKLLSSSRPASSRVCGVWTDVPDVVARQLRRGRLSVVATAADHPDGVVGGRALSAPHREAFSSVLRATTLAAVSQRGGGGGAIASVVARGRRFRLVLHFDATRAPTTQRGPTPVLLNVGKVDGRVMSSYEATVESKHGVLAAKTLVELSSAERRLLNRGKLHLSLMADGFEPSELRGPLTAVRSCDTYDALLVGSNGADLAAFATVRPLEDGSFAYELVASGTESTTLDRFAIVKRSKRLSKRRAVATLESAAFVNGSTSGVFQRQVSARDVALLIREKLDVSATVGGARISGHLHRVLSGSAEAESARVLLVGGASSAAAAAVLLSRPSARDDEKVQDLAVADCSLVFALTTRGIAAGDPSSLQLSICRADGECLDNVSMSSGVALEGMVGASATVSAASWRLLDEGAAVIRLSSAQSAWAALSGRATTTLANDCHRSGRMQRDRFVSEDNSIRNAVGAATCAYMGERYSDGDAWQARHTTCTMCNCHHGRLRCDAMPCPPTPCEQPKRRRPDDCCAACIDEQVVTAVSSGCYWEADKQWHAHGTLWHPYIPPFGFSKCAVCSCPAESSVVRCERVHCPPLPCAPSERVRAAPTDCCSECRVPTTERRPAGDEAPGGCHFQRRRFADGEAFEPRVEHVGRVKCVVCQCRSGRVTCRKTCTA